MDSATKATASGAKPSPRESAAANGAASANSAPGMPNAGSPGAGDAPAPTATVGTSMADLGSAGGAGAQLQAFFQTLLERQCALLGGVGGIIYIAASSGRSGGIGAVYSVPVIEGSARAESGPRGRSLAATRGAAPSMLDRATLQRLARIGAEVLASTPPEPRVETFTASAPGAALYQADPTHRVIACPLVAAEQVHGASVIVAPVASLIGAPEAVQRLMLTSAVYEAHLWQQQAIGEAQSKAKLRETLELLDAAQQGENSAAMGSLFCSELQRRFGCTRVSIGLLRAGRLRLAAVSGSEEIDRRGAATGSIEAAMEECADQDVEIVYPSPAADERDPALRRVTRAHAEHSAKFGPAAMLSLPLRVGGDLVGVTLLERDMADPFPAGAVPLVRLVAEFIGPAVWTKRMADRGVLAVARDRAREIAAEAVGPRHTGPKALVLLIAGLVVCASVIPIPDRVTADSETRASVSRTIPPPFTGFLGSITAKPGDPVKKDQVLAKMDLREATLDLAKAKSKYKSLETQWGTALGEKKYGEAASASAQMEETQADIDLLEDHLAHGEIRAPISGIVSRGDIEPLRGARVEPTQPLFEIVDPGALTVTLDVKERDIGRVRAGQEGSMALTALPGQRLDIRVTRIRPSAEAQKKGNVYLVEAEFLEPAPWVKPGMTGKARLRGGSTTVLGYLLRPVIDAARMRLWW